MRHTLPDNELRDALYQLWRDGRDGEDRYDAVAKIVQSIKAHTAAKVREALLPLKRYEMSLDAMLEIDRLIAELSTNTEDN